MKLLGAFILFMAVVLNLPAIVLITDMMWWFFTDASLSGIVYGTSARPLVVCACTFLSIPVAAAGATIYDTN